MSDLSVLGIFVKLPWPGSVKTRLAEDLGAADAAELYAAFVRDIVERFREVADRRMLCYSPPDTDALDYFQDLAGGDYSFWPQPQTDLGARMAAFFEQSFESGAGRVVVIGSDSPTLPLDYVIRAFKLLAEADCVLGPATDGGYYLVGQRGRPRPLFSGVEWSSASVLEQTVVRVSACGAALALLPPWYDVDALDDLLLLKGHLAALRQANAPLANPATERVLSRLRDPRKKLDRQSRSAEFSVPPADLRDL